MLCFMFVFRVVPASSRTCLLISVLAQRPRVWLVCGGCARRRGELGTACIGLLANDTLCTLKTIRRSLWMDFGCMNEWMKEGMNETKLSCRRLLLCLSVSSVVIIKSHIGCIYYSARCVETRQPWPLVRVLLHSSLTSVRPGCYTFQHWFPHVRVNALGIQRWRRSGIGL
jgi:hypothetical protein